MEYEFVVFDKITTIKYKHEEEKRATEKKKSV